MTKLECKEFDTAEFLAKAGVGRRIVHLKTCGVFFSQGDAADSVFYIQKGRAKLTVVSEAGKNATIRLLSAGDFIGEESITAVTRPSISNSDRHHRLQGPQDWAKRDDSCDA